MSTPMDAVVVASAVPHAVVGIETRFAARDADLAVSRLPHADPVGTTVSVGTPHGRVVVGARRPDG
jgi:hypothetical protein